MSQQILPTVVVCVPVPPASVHACSSRRYCMRKHRALPNIACVIPTVFACSASYTSLNVMKTSCRMARGSKFRISSFVDTVQSAASVKGVVGVQSSRRDSQFLVPGPGTTKSIFYSLKHECPTHMVVDGTSVATCLDHRALCLRFPASGRASSRLYPFHPAKLQHEYVVQRHKRATSPSASSTQHHHRPPCPSLALARPRPASPTLAHPLLIFSILFFRPLARSNVRAS